MKYLSFIIFTIPIIIACGQQTPNNLLPISKIQVNVKDSIPKIDTFLLRKKANEALVFCKQNKMNTQFCLLADMHAHSGLERFFVWSFEKNKVLYAFPVSHGCEDNSWSADFSKDSPVFSNEDGSHCSHFIFT